MDDAALSRAALQAAADGNLRLLKKAAKQVDLRGATNAEGWNALHAAAAQGRVDICRFLIEDEEGPRLDVNSRSAAEGDTPVFLAATEGHLPVLRYLLDRGGDPAMPNAKGLTPLHRAAKNGPCDAVRLLLSKGVPVEPLANRWTPLHFAITGSRFEAVGVLLDHGADIQPQSLYADHYGNHIALFGMYQATGQAGADVNSMTPYGQTALTYAVKSCLPGFEKLKEVGADPSYPGEEVLDDSLGEIIKFLLEAGADPNIPNEYGKIPIMEAAAWGPHKLVQILFSWSKPIPSLPDWNVDAIIRAMKLKAKVGK